MMGRRKGIWAGSNGGWAGIRGICAGRKRGWDGSKGICGGSKVYGIQNNGLLLPPLLSKRLGASSYRGRSPVSRDPLPYV